MKIQINTQAKTLMLCRETLSEGLTSQKTVHQDASSAGGSCNGRGEELKLEGAG